MMTLNFRKEEPVMAKEKKIKVRQKINWKKEMKLAPGYIVIILWVIFTFMYLGWILAASLSTTTDIFAGKALKFPTGLHFEKLCAGMGIRWCGNVLYELYALFTGIMFPADLNLCAGGICTGQIYISW